MEEEKQQMLFMQLVLQNQQIAMMTMGKINNPVTNNSEKNLEMTKISIDTLDMLKEKTKGNLSDSETKYLESVLKELKIMYVEESSGEKQKWP